MKKSDVPHADTIPSQQQSTPPRRLLGDDSLLMLEGLPTLAWHADIEGRRDWFNRAWRDFTGRSSEQECNEGWWESVHPEDLTPCREAYSTAIGSRQIYQLEFRLRHHDGTYHWFKERGQPLFDPQGRYRGYLGLCEELDELHRVQQALRESEVLFQSVVEQNIAGIYIIVDGKLAYVNPAFSEVVGYPKEEIIGRDYTDFVIEEDRPLVAANIRRRLEGRSKSVRYTFRGRRRDGALVDVGVYGA